MMVLDDEVPASLPISPALAERLKSPTLWEIQGFLAGPLGIRRLRCLCSLSDADFNQFVSCRLLAAGYGVGHVCELALLRGEVNGESARLTVPPTEAVRNVDEPCLPAAWGNVPANGQQGGSSSPWAEAPVDEQRPSSPGAGAEAFALEQRESAQMPCQRLASKVEEAAWSLEAAELAASVQQPELSPALVGARHQLLELLQGDTEEAAAQAAQVLLAVDEVAAAWADPLSKGAQKHLQDVVVLCCSLSVEPGELESRGIPAALQRNLSAAFGTDITQLNSLWSRLGNAKHQLFAPGRKWGKRGTRAGRQRRNERAQAPTEGREESSEGVASGELEPVPPPEATTSGEASWVVDVPLPAPTNLCDAESASDFGGSESCCAVSCATSYHSKWQRAAPKLKRALAPRLRASEVLEELAPRHKVDDAVIRLMDELLDELPDIRSCSVVRAWLELSINPRVPQLSRFLSEGSTVELLKAVGRIIQRSRVDVVVTSHCCTTLGRLVEAAGHVATQAAELLLEALQSPEAAEAVQEACLQALQRICWKCHLVLGNAYGDAQAQLEHGILPKIGETVTRIALRQTERLQELSAHVLAHVQGLPEVLRELKGDGAQLEVLLSQYQKVLWGPLQWCWSDTEDWSENGGKECDCAILKDVAKQLPLHAQQSFRALHAAAEAWAQRGTQEHYEKRCNVQRRLMLVGVLFDARVVTSVLRKALDSKDEELASPALRALTELTCLGLVGQRDAREVLRRIEKLDMSQMKVHCCSACLGALGVLAELVASKKQVVSQIIQRVLETAEAVLAKWSYDGVIFESLWALNRIHRECALAFPVELLHESLKLAQKVQEDQHIIEYSECCYRSDAAGALREAQKLEGWVRLRLRHEQ